VFRAQKQGKCLCEHGFLDASFSNYGPQDHLT
jgi:hypothetical protein